MPTRATHAGVTAEDGNVRQGTVEWVAAEIDDDGFVQAGAVDRDDVAGGRRQTPCRGEDVEQAARTDDRNHAVSFTDDRDDSVGTLSDLEGDLWVTVHAIREQLFRDVTARPG